MSEFLKSLKRYAAKGPSIVVDRFAPAPTGKLEIDPNGEYVEFRDILTALSLGVLVELNEDLVDLHADGHAQRALMRDLTALGFDSFEQVMECLEKNRATVLKSREFEIWDVGYQATGEYAPPTLLGKAVGLSFKDACDALYGAEVAKGSHRFNDWEYNERQRCWRNYCGNLVPTKPED